MVRLLYCPNCERAYRFHAKIRRRCPKCNEDFETLDVPRTKFFIIQFPFLIAGMLIIIISLFYLTMDRERFNEPFGMFILGFALLLFALALQFLDSSRMEQNGSEIGKEKFSVKPDTDRFPSERIKTTANLFESTKKVESEGKFEQLKLESILDKEQKPLADMNLFIKPNKFDRVVKTPKRTEELKSVKISQLSALMKQKDDSKKARKIRKAL